MIGEIAAWLKAADVAAFRFLRTRGHWPGLERAVVRYTRLGEHSAIWFGIAALGIALDEKQRHVYLRLVRAVAVVEVVNALLKLVIRRRRPQLDGLPPLTWTRSQRSCPSAHASGSFAAARVLSEALPAAPVYTSALAMAVSRPYLGVHYPSDIVAGMLLGTLIADSVSRSVSQAPGPPGTSSETPSLAPQ